MPFTSARSVQETPFVPRQQPGLPMRPLAPRETTWLRGSRGPSSEPSTSSSPTRTCSCSCSCTHIRTGHLALDHQLHDFLRLGPLPRTSSSSLSPLLHKALRSRPSPWLTVAQVLPSLMPPLPNLTPSVSVSRQRRDLWRLPTDAPFPPATSLTRPFLSSSTSVLIPRASSSMSRVSPTTRSFLVCLGSGSTNRPLTGPSSVFPSAPTIVASIACNNRPRSSLCRLTRRLPFSQRSDSIPQRRLPSFSSFPVR